MRKRRIDRVRSCNSKVVYRFREDAEAAARELAQRAIFTSREPQAYQCRYGKHYHVGNSPRAPKAAQEGSQ